MLEDLNHGRQDHRYVDEIIPTDRARLINLIHGCPCYPQHSDPRRH